MSRRLHPQHEVVTTFTHVVTAFTHSCLGDNVVHIQFFAVTIHFLLTAVRGRSIIIPLIDSVRQRHPFPPTSRDKLEDHHLWYLSHGGCDCGWNRGSQCFCHHRYGIHLGAMKMGGFAPDDLVFMLGINPETGQPFVCYHNERRISAGEATRLLDKWRQSLREGTAPVALSAN